MRPGRGGQRKTKCLSRRGAPALDEPAAWKGTLAAATAQQVAAAAAAAASASTPDGGPPSAATVAPYGSPAAAYSPAPSGASTPGPPPPQQQPPYQHQPFGRPSSGGAGYGPPPGHYGSGYPPPHGGPSPHGGAPGGGGPHQHGPPHQQQPQQQHQFSMPPFGPQQLPHPHGPPHSHLLPPPPDRMDRMVDQGSVPVPRRHTPYFGQPDYRVYELNKRLQQRTEESDNLWWDAFATEFFEDDATLTLTFCLEDGPKRYTIGRTLIPRYFRSIFEGGVTELYYNMKHPKESFHNTSITLDCDQCTMVTHHGKPMFTKVCTEGRLILEFTFDDLMRVKSWHLAVRAHRELIPRSLVGHGPDHNVLEQLSKNITRQGITNSTLNYLRLCVILEPMQELMSRHKAYALSPRDCLKTTLFQKWQRMVAPPESQRPANKRRKRKGSNSGANNVPAVPSKKRSPGPNFSLASQDVMVVGEPSLMGGEFGDEDERLITRLENTQYDGGDGSGVFGSSDGGPGPWHAPQPGPPVPQGPGPTGPPSEPPATKSPH